MNSGAQEWICSLSLNLPSQSLNPNSLLFKCLGNLEWRELLKAVDMYFSYKEPAPKNGRGYKYPPPKTSRWAVKLQNLRRLLTQKLAIRFKTGPEAPQKSPDKVNICLF
jgi:hypothetical protein